MQACKCVNKMTLIDWAGLKPGETSPQYGMKTKDEADAYVGADDAEEEDTPAPADPKAAAKDDIKTSSLTQAEKDAKEKEEKDTNDSLSEEDEIIRIHCAENDDGC